jgi:hypothetical protein
MQEIIDVHYLNAEKIVLVMDNLATHSPAHCITKDLTRR